MEQYVFWLTPAGEARQFLSDKIAELAAAYDGPVFPPHLTLAAPPPCSGDAARSHLAGMKARAPRLRVDGVHTSAPFFKTLFVRFQPNEELKELARVANPHVSLLYADLAPRTKAKLAAAIRLPFTEVCFDRVMLVRCPDISETRAAVESWKLIEEKQLIE